MIPQFFHYFTAPPPSVIDFPFLMSYAHALTLRLRQDVFYVEWKFFEFFLLIRNESRVNFTIESCRASVNLFTAFYHLPTNRSFIGFLCDLRKIDKSKKNSATNTHDVNLHIQLVGLLFVLLVAGAWKRKFIELTKCEWSSQMSQRVSTDLLWVAAEGRDRTVLTRSSEASPASRSRCSPVFLAAAVLLNAPLPLADLCDPVSGSFHAAWGGNFHLLAYYEPNETEQNKCWKKCNWRKSVCNSNW